MGAIEAIEGIERKLTATLSGLTPPVAAPQFAFGESEVGVEDAPPRVTWVPRHGPVKGPQGLGGDATKFPRPLHSVELLFEVHVWAAAPAVDGTGQGEREDMRACETLCNHLVAAINDTLSRGSSQVVSVDWLTGATSTNKLGVVCILGVIIETPFTREIEPMQPINAFPITPEIVPQT